MDIKISNEITINGSTQELVDWCRKELVIDNPDYAKKERMGLWVGNTPRTLSLYKRNGEALILPVGAFRHIKGILDRAENKINYTQDLADNKGVEYNAHINLCEIAFKTIAADLCYIILAKNPRWKTPFSRPEDRLNMLKLALQDKPNFKISLIEYNSKEDITYTYNTIVEFKKTIKDDLYYLIGADQLNKLHEWYKIDELSKMVKFVVFRRYTSASPLPVPAAPIWSPASPPLTWIPLPSFASPATSAPA